MHEREQKEKGHKMSVQRAVALGIFLTCTIAVAGEPLNFVDEAVDRGVDFQIGFNYPQFGSGLMMTDLNGDGYPDLVIAGGTGYKIGIYQNDGTGNFRDRTVGSGIPPTAASSGMSVADYDNDGDVDIFIGGWLSPSRLYRNDGNFQFTDVALEAGVKTNCPLMATCWADIDGDGFLDLYASVRTLTFNDETRNFLYHNNGDGTFTDIAGDLGIDAEDDPTLLAAFFDYDRDGDDDLYLGTDKGTFAGINNRMYRNDLTSFTEVTEKTNTAANVDCMGIAVGDLNFDGQFDLYVTNITAGNKLLMSDGKGSFTDQTAAAGLGNFRIGWGTVFADFDNDTELDVYVCNMLGQNRLYRGSQTWPLIDEAVSANVDVSNDVFCVAIGDVDGDRDLDMLVGNSGGRVHLYINHSVDAATNNSVMFNVVGERNANRFAVGTVVEVQTGKKTQLREVRSGVNYKAQDDYTLHFGLGNAKAITQVNVDFSADKSRTFTNVPMNETWTIYPPSRGGDVNGDGRISISEFGAAFAAISKPGTHIVPGQEIFDLNGDFVIDFQDIAEILSRGLSVSFDQYYTGPFGP